MKPLQIEGIRALAQNGSVNFCGVRKTMLGRFVIEINQIFFVANRKGEYREFAKLDTLEDWLCRTGITKIDKVLL